MKKSISLFLALSLLLFLVSCGKTILDTEGANDSGVANEGGSSVNLEYDDSDMFTDRDMSGDYDEDKSVLIRLEGDSISCSSDSVKISGTTAIISDEGTYIISGTLNDGMIAVNSGEKDKPQIVLNEAVINNSSSASIYILEADKVFVTLAPGTSNSLSNGGAFTSIDKNNIDGALFSKQDLTLNGSGSLTVNSPAGHGIVAKDGLAVCGGTYTVNSAYHGLDANDSVRITNSEVNINSGKDGIHAENSDDSDLGFVYVSGGKLNISAEGDGISASSYMQIEDGAFEIESGGGSTNGTNKNSDPWGGGRPSQTASDDSDSGISTKGLKAAGDILISGGSFSINSADDAVHSNGSVSINEGTFEIASGDDGFHADNMLTIAGGNINITESYEGLEAKDVRLSGGDIRIASSDDGINAAGGTDSSGFGGLGEGDRFGGGPRGPGGHGGFGDPGTSSSDGSIVISGGNIHVKASGDGIDANGTLEISGGYITVCGPTYGDTATLDYDVSGTITGGTFIGTGASGMAQTFSDSSQGVIAVRVGTQKAGTSVSLTESSGEEIISYSPELSFDVVILSTPELVKGETYTLTVGSYSDEISAG